MRKMTGFCAFMLALATAAPAAQLPQRPIDALKQNIQQIAEGIHADWGIYAKSLDTGEEVAIDADQPMETMSVIKVAILVTAFRQIDAGSGLPGNVRVR